MSSQHDASPPEPNRLVELATLFAASRAVFFDVLDDEHHWVPAPGSLAERDLHNSESGPAGEWGENPVRHMFTVVGSYLLTATGHLGGLAVLHASQEALFAPPLLVRAIIENCARVIWVLGMDASDPTRSRVARALLEEILSAGEAKTVAGRLSGKTGEHYEAAQENYLALRDQYIPGLFSNCTREELLGENTLDRQVRPSPEACVLWMYENIAAQGAGVTKEQAQGVYGFLCNMTHPTLYPVRDMLEWVEQEGRLQSYLQLDINFLGRQASAAVITFYNAISLVMSYFGWRSERFSEWEALIDRTLPGTFV